MMIAPVLLVLLLTTLSHSLSDTIYTDDQKINDVYHIYWKVEEDQIFLKLEVKTLGWVGFGIGEPTSGSMPGADIVVSRFDENGNLSVTDRHGLKYGLPEEDKCSDWHGISGHRDNDMTVIELSRSLKTGDTQDRDILPGFNRILWAYGLNDEFGYHQSRRGTEVVAFYNAPAKLNVTADFYIEMIYDVATPPIQKTTYMCQAWRLPNETAHIIQIDPLVDSTTKKYVHHFLLHVCDLSSGEVFDKYSTPKVCDGDVMSKCSSIAFAWALGMGPLVLPAEAGFLIGEGDRAFQWLVLETHFDNPDGVKIEDRSGVRLHVQEKLRPMDAGILTLGDPVTTFPDIPAGVSNSIYQTNCPKECTDKFTHEITVFASFLHMHNIGKQMLTTLHRDGELLNITNRVDFYQFNFQQITETQFTIKPGDRLNTMCVFDSTERAGPTKFGPASDDEMCMDFLMYYPLLLSQNDGKPYTRCGAVTIGENTVTLCGSRSEYDPNLINPTIALPESILEIEFGTPCGDSPKPHFRPEMWMIVAAAVVLGVIIIGAIAIGVVIHRKNKNSYSRLIR